MKYFFHLRPPLPLFSRWERILQRTDDSPPVLGFWVSSHLRPVLFDVCSVIFEISKQDILFEEDGVVANVALRDLAQHFGPNSGVVSLVFLSAPGLDVDHCAESLHSGLLKTGT